MQTTFVVYICTDGFCVWKPKEARNEGSQVQPEQRDITHN